MPKRVVVLSGPVVSGKSTLGQELANRFGFLLVKTHELIRHRMPKVPKERKALQAAGESLDRATDGAWVAEGLDRRLSAEDESASIVVDAVRIKKQVDHLRQAYGALVVHVHLTAPVPVLEQRYRGRQGEPGEVSSYDDVRRDPTEANVDSLSDFADVLIDTQRSSADDVFARVASRLRLYGAGVTQLVDVLIGGQFGSEGKGHIVSYLAPEYQVLVRVGGPNAGHTVYGGPSHERFYHLPSGSTRAPGATLVLGPGAAIWLEKLHEEISTHKIEADRLRIDPQAIIIEEADREGEAALRKGIASTAQGVGWAAARKIYRGHNKVVPDVRLARDEPSLGPYLGATSEVLEDAYASGKKVLMEGTQGTLLSLHHGMYPYVTSRDTTASGALAEAGIPPARVRKTIMVCRSYPIRVQSPPGPGKTSGPMGIELTWEVISERSGIPLEELKTTELSTTTKKLRRVAEFGWSDVRRAAVLNGPTDIALSFADYLDIKNRDARRFEQLTPDTIKFIEELERVTCAPVSLISTRFSYPVRSIVDRRRWSGEPQDRS